MEKVIGAQMTISTGHRTGETHGRAKYPDSLVEMARQAHDNGEGGYKRLALRFGVPVDTMRDWLAYRTR